MHNANFVKIRKDSYTCTITNSACQQGVVREGEAEAGTRLFRNFESPVRLLRYEQTLVLPKQRLWFYKLIHGSITVNVVAWADILF